MNLFKNSALKSNYKSLLQPNTYTLTGWMIGLDKMTKTFIIIMSAGKRPPPKISRYHVPGTTYIKYKCLFILRT